MNVLIDNCLLNHVARNPGPRELKTRRKFLMYILKEAFFYYVHHYLSLLHHVSPISCPYEYTINVVDIDTDIEWKSCCGPLIFIFIFSDCLWYGIARVFIAEVLSGFFFHSHTYTLSLLQKARG